MFSPHKNTGQEKIFQIPTKAACGCRKAKYQTVWKNKTCNYNGIEFSATEIDDHLLSTFIYPHLHFTFQEVETPASSHLSKGSKKADNPHGKKMWPWDIC